MDESVCEWVSEWVGGWVSEWVGGWVVEWVSEWVSGWVSERVSEWVSELASERVSTPALLVFDRVFACRSLLSKVSGKTISSQPSKYRFYILREPKISNIHLAIIGYSTDHSVGLIQCLFSVDIVEYVLSGRYISANISHIQNGFMGYESTWEWNAYVHGNNGSIFLFMYSRRNPRTYRPTFI